MCDFRLATNSRNATDDFSSCCGSLNCPHQERAKRMDWHHEPHFSVPSPSAARAQAESPLISACALLESHRFRSLITAMFFPDFEYTLSAKQQPCHTVFD